jgi:hypothetical protein
VNGTVQTIQPNTTTFAETESLTKGEERDWYVALMQQAPLDLDPAKIRHYLANKRELGADLRSVLGKPLPEFDTALWQKFFKKHFGRTFDLSNLHVPQKPAYPCRAILIRQGLTNNQIFDACTKAFKTWRYANDLDVVRDVVERHDGPYIVWVRDTVEADPDMANKSASDIEAVSINTLKERMLLELAYFDETGRHLDINNWTLCAGSRYLDGTVPRCRWDGGMFIVHWSNVGSRNPGLRARVAVS